MASVAGCKGRELRKPEGEITEAEAMRYIERAVGQSSEGVVLMPSKRAETDYDRVRLNEAAQAMRGPLAVCFLQRAILSMKMGEVDGEPGWVDVPDGQAKLRARLDPNGNVMAVEVLASEFDDSEMEACVMGVVERTKFPESRRDSSNFIDVVYWVSLGFHAGASSQEFATLMRREGVEAGLRSKRCLEGKVPPGDYTIAGVNLFDRNGDTLVNRVENGDFPRAITPCLAQAFKGMQIGREAEAFVRPAEFSVQFTIESDGAIVFADEEWLRLVQLEEQAQRDAQRAKLESGNEVPVDDGGVSGVVPELGKDPSLDPDAQGPLREDAPPRPDEARPPVKTERPDGVPTPRPEQDPKTGSKPRKPKKDPGKGGQKLDLGSPR